MRALCALVLAGCWNCPPLLESPKGIPINIRPEVTIEWSWILEWADLRAEQWIDRKAEWGLGAYTDEQLWAVVRDLPVIVYPGDVLANGYIGTTYYGSHIDIAVGWRSKYTFSQWDPPPAKNPLDSRGLDAGLAMLGHEWKHALLGAWHPQ